MLPFFIATRNFTQEIFSGLLHLAYPDLCAACQYDLPVTGNCFCIRCQLKLHPSDMYKSVENEFTQRFFGRLLLQTGAAQYYFTRKSPIQRAIHQLKYRNQPEVGIKIGRDFARQLRTNPVFKSVDMIVPVPLHPRRERLRGYNQSTMFARGLSEILEAPVVTHVLQRQKFTQTQTRKKRLERFQNMGNVFVVKHPDALAGKHILLVDDLLTTGATLEMCGLALLEAPGSQLSIATIAIAML
jgi:ComF family protein